MIQIDLDKLVQNIFAKDLQDNGKMTNRSELTTIIIKSILPHEKRNGNMLDYRRFKEELNLWTYYRGEEEGLLKEIIGDKNTWDYFNYKDDSLYTRIIPLIVANQDYDIIEKEVVRNLLFTSGDLKELWKWLGSIRIVFNLIEGKDQLIEDLKSYIITFSQVDYIKSYEEFYRFPLKDYPGNFNIQFEREKINLLNILNQVDTKAYDEFKDLLDIVEGQEGKTNLGKILLASQKNASMDNALSKFYINLNEYVLKLRKSRIDPEDLRIKEYDLPDIFSFKEGQVFFHSLIKDGKVIKKEVKNNVLTSLVQTRSGMYLFKRDPF